MGSSWHRVRNAPHVSVRILDLPDGLLGFCDHATETIYIRAGLTQRERNAVLEHEWTHLQRGPVPLNEHYANREEAAVREATARELVPIADFAAALRWSRDVHDLADELHVPVYVVVTRWFTIRHPAERAALERVLADLEELIAP